MTEAATEPTPRDLILAWADQHGVTMTAAFVPYSQSRSAKALPDGKPWRSFNWRVTLARAGRVFLETDYSAGSGHAPAQKAGRAILMHSGYSEGVAREMLTEWEIEHGFPGIWFSACIHRQSRAAPIMPDLADVLYSLSSDASVIDYGGFEQWASEFGYDTDSRKAEGIYRACLECALKMRNALGEAGLEALAAAAQDF
jgi:hypothetical protein